MGGVTYDRDIVTRGPLYESAGRIGLVASASVTFGPKGTVGPDEGTAALRAGGGSA